LVNKILKTNDVLWGMSGSALKYWLFLNGTDPEDGGKIILRNVCNFLPIEMSPYLTISESSSIPL
jgi:hypothetical protein